ncbi:MAG: hypothetical protein L6R40_008606 [Gallowayella cf. fulva]|nr:MAG: hypothetical protein L6R40_008606 [Xanthomendoza cf. fulva]
MPHRTTSSRHESRTNDEETDMKVAQKVIRQAVTDPATQDSDETTTDDEGQTDPLDKGALDEKDIELNDGFEEVEDGGRYEAKR